MGNIEALACAKTAPVAVSLIIPVYNVEQYLTECLESVLAQTFTDFEIICVNDGSTDSSPKILQSFAGRDQRFRIIDQANSGYGAAMNRGLAAAQGQYIAILESDDFMDPEMLAALYSTARQYDAEVVKANCYFYWSSPKPKNKLAKLVPLGQVNRLVNPQTESQIFHLKPSIWSAIYKRAFLEQNQIGFLETPGASYQDAGFNLKVWIAATRVVFLAAAYLHYRQDNENSSINSAAKVYCVCDEFSQIIDYLNLRPEQSYLLPIVYKMKHETYLWNYERLDSRFQLEFLERMALELGQDVSDGKLDLTLFNDWHRADLQTILDSPERYHQQWSAKYGRGQLGRLQHYFKVGGIALVAKIVKHQIGKK